MNLFVLTMLFPMLSFFILSASQGKWSQCISTVVGLLGVGIATLITCYLLYCNVFIYKFNDFICFQELWSWFQIDSLHITIRFRLDKLSLMMLSIITGIGFVIHIYAIWYMNNDKSYARFFAYTNLFIFNMIVLVLSDNLLLIYFGWEGVGLCSYLLIGFYYFNPKNGLEAMKAFIMTRFGDICLMCALFMIYDQYHTLNLDILLQLTPQYLYTNMSSWISVMLLIGCIGKSAQLPLQNWLVNAMVGPTPVSALIHAATMVTSGIYLINRLHNFFLITPNVLYAIEIIGSITLIIAACSALFQNNIKKILAYSTISQIGYMFIALGCANWIGSMFHLAMHSIFKALLFLIAGVLIRSCQNEQNIFKMGGLYRSMPTVYICFLIGAASLSGFPIITSGFYSKRLILLCTFDNITIFAELAGLFLTAMYAFRMVFVIFHGKQRIIPLYNINHVFYKYIPLIILSLFSTMIGSQMQLFFSNIIINNHNTQYQMYLMLISEILVFLGIWIASVFWLNISLNKMKGMFFLNRSLERITRYLILICHYGWGFDWVYRMVFVKSYLLMTKKLFNCIHRINSIINLNMIVHWLGKSLLYIENGRLNWYAATMNIGIVVILLIVLINL